MTPDQKAAARRTRTLELVQLARSYDADVRRAALTELEQLHRGLVEYAVRRRGFLFRHAYLEADLRQVAQLGLIRAVETFDPTLGSFSGYALTWIRMRVGRYYDRNADVLGARQMVLVNNRGLRRRGSAFRHAMPEILQMGRHAGTPNEHEASQEFRLEQELAREDPAFEALETEERERLCRSLAPKLMRVLFLEPREAEILVSRARGQNLAEIGERLKISRERVRQLELAVTAKVRSGVVRLLGRQPPDDFDVWLSAVSRVVDDVFDACAWIGDPLAEAARSSTA